MREFLAVVGIGGGQHDAGLAPAVSGGLGDLADHFRADRVPRLRQYACEVGHDPRRAIDAVVGRRLVQKAEHRLLTASFSNLRVDLTWRANSASCPPSAKIRR